MEKIRKSEEQWRSQLSEEEYRICREKGTEPPFTGAYWRVDPQPRGQYRCRCCELPLFAAGDKFDSGSGWPSFTRPLAEEYVEEYPDASMGMHRTEACCARCDAHLGHVFPDGPAPTGLRYCINSASLTHHPEDEGA